MEDYKKEIDNPLSTKSIPPGGYDNKNTEEKSS